MMAREKLVSCCMKHVMGIFCAFMINTIFAVDLTVERDVTHTLSAEESAVSYNTVTVSGKLVIEKGKPLNTKILNLGPNAGDEAVVEIDSGSWDMLKVSDMVTIGGAEGGTGKIVALNDASSTDVSVFDIPNVSISANATLNAGSGTIDFLELGRMRVHKINAWKNNSTTPARVRIRDGQLGFSQNFSGTYFNGSFVLDGYNERSDITIANTWTGNWTLNSGSLAITTGGTVTFTYNSSSDSHNLNLNNGLVWGGGDVVLKDKATFVCNANNLLPFGSEGGSLRVDSENAGVNIGSTTQHLNSFIAAKRTTQSTAALKGSASSRLVFGADDMDGVLSGDIQKTVSVEKVGTGTLTVNGAASCGSLHVKEGTLRVVASFDVETLIVDKGATLVVDGVLFAPSVHVCILGEVRSVNGGICREATTVSCETDIRTEGFASTGQLIKEGAGWYVMAGSPGVAEDIYVKEGALSFAAGWYGAKLYRFNFTDWQNVFSYTQYWSDNQFLLAELALIDADSQRIGRGTALVEAGTSPAALQPGQAAFAAGTRLHTEASGSLFDAAQWTRTCVTSPLTTDDGGVTLYMRLPDNAPPVSAWNFAAAYGGHPKTWTVSASKDNGTTWEVLNEATDFSVKDHYYMCWFGGSDLGDIVPSKFPLNTTNLDFADAVAKEDMPKAMAIRIDADAVLDFSKVIGGQTVNGLTLAVNINGGTVSNAVLATVGVINLILGEDKMSDCEMAFDFGDSQGVENLANWMVTCDGMPMEGVSVNYDATAKKFTFRMTSVEIAESGEGAKLGTIDGLVTVNVAAGVAYTNTTAISGSGSLVKKGNGTLVLSAPAENFTGTFAISEGIVEAPVSGAFGTGTVEVKGSTAQTTQLVLGSTTENTVYDNDFVFNESSNEAHPALFFITETQKTITLNGDVTAHGNLFMRDSKNLNSQMAYLVTFNGNVDANGWVIDYPTDNLTTWNGKVTSSVLHAYASFPVMGRHCFASTENKIGRFELSYISVVLAPNALNGSAIHLIGDNHEDQRGSIYPTGDQTGSWIHQDNKTYQKKYEPANTSTLTLTGGTSYASCNLNLKNGTGGGKTSFVLDALNDDFVQEFVNAAWEASGDVTVRNGTLRFAGTASLPKIKNLEIEGGALELETTAENACAMVGNITLGATARLKVASTATTPFASNVELAMAEGAVLDLPEGAEVTIRRGVRGTRRMEQGTFTGEGGAIGIVKPWIRGTGILNVRFGGGFTLIIR